MDENPYKAPQTDGQPPHQSNFVRQAKDLALLVLTAIVVLIVLMVLFANLFGPRVNPG
jgi:hypothetical protein